MATRGKIIREAALTESSARLGVNAARLRIAVEAAQSLEEPEFEVVRELVRLSSGTPQPLERRREMSAGLCEALERLWSRVPEQDPLADVDEPLNPKEAASVLLWADATVRLNRARLLADCISASQAGQITNRSRQAVERQRREGRLVALRAGRQWRYPKWQFDIDGPGGLVAGLDVVVRSLRLSPHASALWLTTPKAELGGKAPIAALHKRQTDRVIRLAEEQGHAL